MKPPSRVLAESALAGVELLPDGLLRLSLGDTRWVIDRATCEELTTTLALAMVTLARVVPKHRGPVLSLVRAPAR